MILDSYFWSLYFPVGSSCERPGDLPKKTETLFDWMEGKGHEVFCEEDEFSAHYRIAHSKVILRPKTKFQVVRECQKLMFFSYESIALNSVLPDLTLEVE